MCVVWCSYGVCSRRVSVSRRSFGGGCVSVLAWGCESQAACKALWSMAIAQHQYYLDCNTARVSHGTNGDGSAAMSPMQHYSSMRSLVHSIHLLPA